MSTTEAIFAGIVALVFLLGPLMAMAAVHWKKNPHPGPAPADNQDDD